MSGSWKRIYAFLAALALLAAASCAGAEQVKLGTVEKAVAYVKENQPAELDLGEVRMSPQEIWTIKQSMPENGVLHFTIQWGGTKITDRDTLVDLNKSKGGVSVEALSKLVEILPDVQKIDVSELRHLSNAEMPALVEKYPQVQFAWYIVLNRHHSLISDNTAYSSFNEPHEKVKLNSDQLEMLKYAPGLKALDLGHNKITSLDFLRYFPDIEFLILGDNQISDITILGTLKHLKYLEIFSVPITDISALAGCTELMDLNLCYNTEITDLSPLAGLTSLERFWGNHMTGLSAEEKAKFIADHPNVETVFDGKHATSDGWRLHERYSHYRTCLKRHVWVPFGQPLD